MNQFASEPRELQQSGRIASLQGADDVNDISARTKRPPGAGDYDHAHVVFIAQLRKKVREFVIDLERDRVQTLGPVERDGSDPAVLFVEETLWSIHSLFIALFVGALLYYFQAYRQRS